MIQKKLVVPILFTMFLGITNLNAQIADKISIHGFGGWGYGNTDGNNYLLGSKGGNYHNSNFSLNITTAPYEKLVIVAQMKWEDRHEGLEVELSYAFAEWSFSDALKLRFGRIKQPFGIYSEIYDVGTIRPFFFLPQAVYGPVGITALYFDGIGISGAYYAKNGWGISYDFYGGEIDLLDSHAWHILEAEDQGENEYEELEVETEHTKDTAGGKLVISTPVEGLSFGFSAFAGKHEAPHEEAATGEPFWGNHRSYAIHVEYFTDNWLVRSEYARHICHAHINVNTFYLEVAYKFTERWQVAARYDWLDSELSIFDVSEAPSLIEHKNFAMGLNYWFTSGLVLKLSYHTVDGNRFAMPENLYEAIEESVLDTKTNLVQFGVQFSF